MVRQALQRVDGKLESVRAKANKMYTITCWPSLSPLWPPIVLDSARSGNSPAPSGEKHGSSSPPELEDHSMAAVFLRTFDRILKSAGLPKIRFHDLRHSAATFLLAQE